MRIKDARQTFLGVWIFRLLQGQPFEVWGGHQLRDYTYVDDCVSALQLASSNDIAIGQIYNLGGMNKPVTLLETAETLVAAAHDLNYPLFLNPLLCVIILRSVRRLILVTTTQMTLRFVISWAGLLRLI